MRVLLVPPHSISPLFSPTAKQQRHSFLCKTRLAYFRLTCYPRYLFSIASQLLGLFCWKPSRCQLPRLRLQQFCQKQGRLQLQKFTSARTIQYQDRGMRIYSWNSSTLEFVIRMYIAFVGKLPCQRTLLVTRGLGMSYRVCMWSLRAVLYSISHILCLCLVGSSLDEAEWMGRRVGIRWVEGLFFCQGSVIDIRNRWLYSSCLNCEICVINHTACPYQKNAGVVCPMCQIYIPSGV